MRCDVVGVSVAVARGAPSSSSPPPSQRGRVLGAGPAAAVLLRGVCPPPAFPGAPPPRPFGAPLRLSPRGLSPHSAYRRGRAGGALRSLPLAIRRSSVGRSLRALPVFVGGAPPPAARGARVSPRCCSIRSGRSDRLGRALAVRGSGSAARGAPPPPTPAAHCPSLLHFSALTHETNVRGQLRSDPPAHRVRIPRPPDCRQGAAPAFGGCGARPRLRPLDVADRGAERPRG